MEKSLRRLPRYVVVLFDAWRSTIEVDGYQVMQKMKGYRDHALSGKRKGQRSSSITKGYRVIYEIKKDSTIRIIEVLEVNKHAYKK